MTNDILTAVRESYKRFESLPRTVYLAQEDFDRLVEQFAPDMLVDAERPNKAIFHGMTLWASQWMPVGQAIVDYHNHE